MSLFAWFRRRRQPSLSELSVDEKGMSTEQLRSVMGDALISDLIKERRSERNWRHIKRIMISGSAVVIFAIYVGFYVTSLGYHVVPSNDIVGVVRITGGIEEGSQTASANAVIPALSKAFNKPNVKAIVLAIDSPGGKPAEVERIYNYIAVKKKETGKPVVAVIGNTGASAAYMLAVHADKVYAGKYSIVGSIGAIMSSWDFHKIADRFDVKHKVYASGKLKGMLDPWSPPSAQADAKAQDMVDGMGKIFAAEVRLLRGDKLAKDVDFFTGEVWSGEDALQLGLVDEVGTLDSMIKQTYNLGYHDFGPKKGGGGFSFPFSAIFSESQAEALLSSILAKLAPSGENQTR